MVDPGCKFVRKFQSMFYCFVYPESIDRMLLEYFDRDTEERTVEITKCKVNGVFYICKSHECSMYLPIDRKGVQCYARICGDVQSIVESSSIARRFEVRLSKFRGEPVPREHGSGMDFLLGKISSDGRKMGNFLIYRDDRTRRALADILRKYEITETSPSGDMHLDMISLLAKLERI